MSSSGRTRAAGGALLCALALAQAPSAQASTDPPAVTVAGHGGAPTYVLVSGMMGGVAGYRRLEGELLARGARVVVVDPYALSLDSAAVTFADLARRVDQALVRLGVDSAHVVGHAHGGGVALRLAALDPARVAALTLLDVGALPQNRTKVFSGAIRLVPLIARMPGGRRFVRAQILRGVRQNAGRHGWLDTATQRAYTEPVLRRIGRVVAMAGRLAETRESERLEQVVARVRAPVTVILGEVPHPSGPDSAEFAVLAPLGARLRIVRLAGVGHFPHEEAPADVARYLATAPAARGAALPARPGPR